MTSRHIVALFLDDNKTNDDGDGTRTSSILCISLPSLYPCAMKLPNFTPSLYEVGEHKTKVVFLLF